MMSTSENMGKSATFREVWLLLWRRLGSHRMLFILALVLGLSQTLIMMMIPAFSELYFNQLERGAFRYVQWLIVIGTAFALIMTFAALISEYMKQVAMTRLKRDLTIEMADHAQRLPLERVQGAHSSDLVQRVTHDTGRTTGLLTLVMDHMGNQVTMFLLAALYMIWLQWSFALVVLAISPLAILGSHLLRHRLRTIGQATAEQESIVRQYQQETLQGMEIIRAYGISDWMRERFVEQRTILNSLYMRRMWWQQMAAASSTLVTSLLILLMVLIIGRMAIQGSLALGAIMAFFILIWRVVSPLQSLGSLWGQLQEGLGAASRVTDIWFAEKEAAGVVDGTDQDDQTTNGNADKEGRLILRDVSFAYRGAGNGMMDVLISDFNLQISPGSFVAIVGPSGSGKSTIAKLAAGLLFPSEGEVSIGGVNPAENAEQARQMIAYVSQTLYLFSGTIRENLQIVSPGAEDAELKHVLRLAQADGWLATFPDGLDHAIGEQGSSLSGGQRQRLAIARALLVKRPIYILDEATSALDQDTESKVMDSMRKVVSEQRGILLVIAHRLVNVQGADVIIVMENGVIREQGTHQQLMQSSNGLYAKLRGEADD